MDVNTKISKAIKLLQRFRDRPVTILFSGGKDSLAALLLALDAGLKRFNIVYAEVTGNTHPACTLYVYNVCKKLGVLDRLVVGSAKAKGRWDFYTCLVKWGIPWYRTRWCLNNFKVPIWQKHGYRIHVCGIRASESHEKSKLNMVRFTLQNAYMVNPLYTWTDADVLDYIKSRGVEINPLYDIYLDSGNCMFCPFKPLPAVARVMQDQDWGPKIARALMTWLETVKDYRGAEIGKRVATKWLRFYKQNNILTYL